MPDPATGEPQPKISKIEVDKEKCISVASCVELASKTFRLDDEGKAEAFNLTDDQVAEQMDAAKSCPVNAINVYDENGKKIWPIDP